MRKGAIIFWSVFISIALLRFVGSFSRVAPDASGCIGSRVVGRGVLVEEPVRTDTKQTLVVAAKSPQCIQDMNVRIQTKVYPRFVYGDEVDFSGKLLKPFNFKSGDGRAFDYRGYLAKDGIFYEMKSAEASFASTSTMHLISVPAALYSVRRHFVASLQAALGEPQAALAAGLVVGEKSALGKSLIDDFRIVGLIHIVVLSGYNITIVGVALRRILSFLPRAWGIVVGALGIILFGILVGGGATVVRSCFMASIALFGDLLRRDYSVGRALAFAALVMIIQNPMIVLHDPSFQLSFLATLGLLLFATPIEAKLGRLPEKFGIRGTVASTFATQLSVSPYILYMMGQISIIGIVVNILVLPFIPLTMLAVCLTGLAGLISQPLALAIGWAAHAFLTYELFMVEAFARVPFAALKTSPLPGWSVCFAYAVLIAGFIAWKLRRLREPQGTSSPRLPS